MRPDDDPQKPRLWKLDVTPELHETLTVIKDKLKLRNLVDAQDELLKRVNLRDFGLAERMVTPAPNPPSVSAHGAPSSELHIFIHVSGSATCRKCGAPLTYTKVANPLHVGLCCQCFQGMLYEAMMAPTEVK